MARNVLRKLLGGVAYALVRPKLRNVRIKIHPDRQELEVVKAGKSAIVKFAEIEKVVNEQD